MTASVALWRNNSLSGGEAQTARMRTSTKSSPMRFHATPGPSRAITMLGTPPSGRLTPGPSPPSAVKPMIRIEN
jgi:hypothetical protein